MRVASGIDCTRERCRDGRISSFPNSELPSSYTDVSGSAMPAAALPRLRQRAPNSGNPSSTQMLSGIALSFQRFLMAAGARRRSGSARCADPIRLQWQPSFSASGCAPEVPCSKSGNGPSREVHEQDMKASDREPNQHFRGTCSPKSITICNEAVCPTPPYGT